MPCRNPTPSASRGSLRKSGTCDKPYLLSGALTFHFFSLDLPRWEA